MFAGRLITYSPNRGPFRILIASLLFSSKAASFSFHPPAATSARRMITSASIMRRSSRLQKRSLSTRDDNATTQPAPIEYTSLKVVELRDLCKQRGLAVSGVKSVLVERLTSSSGTNVHHDGADICTEAPTTKRTKKKRASVTASPQPTVSTQPALDCLPRTRELQLNSKDPGGNLAIIGVDEAGRGPLAGPVVAAAAIVPTNISGIIDSKKITKEEERERIYEDLIASPGIRYAVSIINAQRIDKINILQATLEGMRMAVEAVMKVDEDVKDAMNGGNNLASAERTESYVITGRNAGSSPEEANNKCSYYALIDGNKVPKDMPCVCESMTKGDGREYSIGAASILAKVTRDRLMHEYDAKYPHYNLAQHKGYPTAAHMSAVKKYGASPIHRRTFAPLKHMEFDEEGKVIG